MLEHLELRVTGLEKLEQQKRANETENNAREKANDAQRKSELTAIAGELSGLREDEKAKQVAKSDARYKKRCIERWHDFRKFAVLFAAIGAFFAAWRAAGFAEQQVRVSERAAISESRAYMYVSKVAFVKGFENVSEPAEVNVYFLNGGETPARNVRAIGHTVWALSTISDPTSIPVDGDTPGGASFMYKDTPMNLDMFASRSLTKSEIASVEFGDYDFVFWGYVTYDDVFDTNHKMTFCYIANAASFKAHSFVTCKTGNDDK